MRAPRPSNSVHCERYSFSSTGTRKASVLPLPVFAAPRTSLFLRARGMAPFWTSVRVVKWEALRPEAVGCERGRSENLVASVDFTSCSLPCQSRSLCKRDARTYKFVDALLEALEVVLVSLPLLLADFRPAQLGRLLFLRPFGP